jgi:hypothetical protein
LEHWPERWAEAVRLCQGSPVPLPPGKSADFLEKISHYTHRPSEAQLTWLLQLVVKCAG